MIDKASDGHHDLFLKVDVMISHLKIADSFFLYDFLEIRDDDYQQLEEGTQLQFAASKLINYWIGRIKMLERGQKTFILFDLSDQYIGGLTLEKNKRGFKTRFVFTKELCGSDVSISTLDERIIASGAVFFPSVESEWLIGEEALFNGLNWSLEQLKQ
ncbi:MAG: hypothetical protein EOO39_08160 [Cytophagaceae bacterium]|nr:MAG: hypothetical protein EOO39_08160 [Cytophagaceae bacterium]